MLTTTSLLHESTRSAIKLAMIESMYEPGRAVPIFNSSKNAYLYVQRMYGVRSGHMFAFWCAKTSNVVTDLVYDGLRLGNQYRGSLGVY